MKVFGKNLGVCFSVLFFVSACSVEPENEAPNASGNVSSIESSQLLEDEFATAESTPEDRESAACKTYKAAIATRNFFIDNVTGLEMKYINTRVTQPKAITACYNLTPTHKFKLATTAQLKNLGHLFINDFGAPCKTDIWGYNVVAGRARYVRHLMPGASLINGGSTGKALCILGP